MIWFQCFVAYTTPTGCLLQILLKSLGKYEPEVEFPEKGGVQTGKTFMAGLCNMIGDIVSKQTV